MRSKGTRVVKLADIRNNMFVREKLNEEWALQLAQLMEDGVEMRDLIEVTESNGVLEMVDGRHRQWGYDLNGVNEVKVKVLEFDDAAEAVAYAFNRNKGSRPPTTGDTEHTIQVLAGLGTSIKRIAEMIDLPLKVIQRYIQEIRAKEKRTLLRKGEDLVREQNFKVTEAAAEVGVKPEELKGFLGGHRKRRSEVAEMQKELSRLQRSTSGKVARLLDKVFDQFEVGDLSRKQAEKILAKVEALHRQWGKTVADRRASFTAKANGQGEDQEQKRESA